MQIVKRTPFAWMSGSHGAGAKVNAEASEPELKAPLRHDGFYGEPLSEAELRVLVLLVGGRSVSEVARELYLAPTTVKTHRRTIYRKLGVTDRQEAIARAAELGLTRLELAKSSRMNAASPPSRPHPTVRSSERGLPEYRLSDATR